MQDLLQAEKHDELIMRNHHQYHVGMDPLPEVNYSSKGKEKVNGQNNHPKNSGKSKKGKRNKHKKNKSKDQSWGKARNLSSAAIVVVLIILQKNAIYPQHLVDLYQKSLKEARKTKGSFEAHFNTASNEATTSGKIPDKAAKPSLMVKDYIGRENMIVEYNPNDVFENQD
jgi:hypothetical protein